MEANTNTVPEDITQIQHQTASLTGLLMSTNKASCRNTTSPLWHLELLSNQVFSHTFRPWEFAFSPSRHRGRETERVKDRELSSSERVKYELQLLARSCNKMSSPWGQSPWTCHIYFSTMWSYTTTQHSYPALQTSVRPYLRHLPYTQFASRFGFTPLILSEKAGEEMAEGNSWEVEEVGKWVRGLGPKRRQLPLQHLGLPPESSTSPSPPLWGVEVTVGEGPLRGLQIGSGFTVPARSCMQKCFQE